MSVARPHGVQVFTSPEHRTIDPTELLAVERNAEERRLMFWNRPKSAIAEAQASASAVSHMDLIGGAEGLALDLAR